MASLPKRGPSLAAVALLLALGASASATGPFYLGLNYGNKPPTDPLYLDNQFDLFYPNGVCPVMQGCRPSSNPVVVLLHGGNTNNPLVGPGALSPLGQLLLTKGFVVVVPSFHEVDYDLGESYLSATQDIARLIQYVRFNRVELSIDPARVFCFGHSSGAFQAYHLGLNADFAQPAALDPLEHESSRPDFLIPWGGATDWGCFDYANPATNPIISFLIFGATSMSEVSQDEIMLASAAYWLQNPDLYDRTTTPPMCLVYNLEDQGECGSILNVHDGYFGTLMLMLLGRACGGPLLDQPTCTESVLLDALLHSDVVNAQIADWMVARAWP